MNKYVLTIWADIVIEGPERDLERLAQQAHVIMNNVFLDEESVNAILAGTRSKMPLGVTITGAAFPYTEIARDGEPRVPADPDSPS